MGIAYADAPLCSSSSILPHVVHTAWTSFAISFEAKECGMTNGPERSSSEHRIEVLRLEGHDRLETPGPRLAGAAFARKIAPCLDLLVGWPSGNTRCRIASADMNVDNIGERAHQAPYLEGTSGLHVGGARGLTALWRCPRTDRSQFRGQRGRIVFDHWPQRRRQDLDRQLYFGALQANRRSVVLSWQRHHESKIPTRAPHWASAAPSRTSRCSIT